MAQKQVLTTWEAGRYCNTSPYTVRNWIRSGQLPAYTTPGGHRRVRRQDLDAFLLAHNMPIPEDFQAGKRRLLILGNGSARLAGELEHWSPDLEVHWAPTAFDAGLVLTSLDPHLFLVDLDEPEGGLAACRSIKNSPALSHVKVVAAARRGDVETTESAQQAGVLHLFSKPLDRVELLRFLKRLFPTCRWPRAPKT